MVKYLILILILIHKIKSNITDNQLIILNNLIPITNLNSKESIGSIFDENRLDDTSNWIKIRSKRNTKTINYLPFNLFCKFSFKKLLIKH